MCLDIVLKRKEFLSKTKIKKHQRNSELKVGWKAVIIRNGKITPPHFSNKKSFSIGEWLNEKDFRRDTYIDESRIGFFFNTYPIGFHILATFRDGEYYSMASHLRHSKIKLIKVYYKRAVAYGKQEGCYTVITKKIYIPRQTPFTYLGNKCKKQLR